MSNSYDVITNGASLAGCTAAVLYAREGARVALLERRSAPRAHKVLCTHYIQPCAYPVTAELGLDKLLEQAGAVPNTAHYWTRWDWIIPPWHEDVKHGYSVRRETLDPILRSLAAGTEGVDLLLGRTANELLREEDRVELSAPAVTLTGAAAERAAALGLGPISVSIAHKDTCVVAVAVGGAPQEAPPLAARATQTLVRKIARLGPGAGEVRNQHAR